MLPIRLATIFLSAYLALLPIAGCIAPVKEGIEAENFRINSFTVLRKSDTPHVYSNIIVESSGVLQIDAGVHIQLSPGGSIIIDGTLRAKGTLIDRIYIEPVQSGTVWQGLHATRNCPDINLEFVSFRRFQEPIFIESKALAINKIVLEDGIYNVLHLGSPGMAYPDTDLTFITFTNRLQGWSMKDNGMFLEGSYGKIRIMDISFNDPRVSEPMQWRVGAWFTATRKSVQFVHISFSLGCTFRFKDPIADENLYIGTEAESCHTEKLPVLFLPGYGASVNLSHLAKALPVEPDTSGWRFITPVTQPYKYMLDHLKESGVPYKKCFYDWRLPSAQIVEEYLRPAIDALKVAHRTTAVKIVAHSYGGLVARSYVQGDTYQGDVYQVIQVGTPNQGAVKAYSVWEGGILPPDWQALENLVRYYMFINKNYTRIQTVRTMFPSVRELLPIYPSLYYRRTELADPAKLRQPNLTLLSLRTYLEYFTKRTRVTTLRSTEKATITTMLLKVPPAVSKEMWTDGEPYQTQPMPLVDGDGTVPSESVELTGAENLVVKGTHSELTATALEDIFTALDITLPTVPANFDVGRSAENMLWFMFDCPIEVSIKLPDGQVVNTTEVVPKDSSYDVVTSEEMKWLVVPSMPGQYVITITGLENTPVRYWVNDEEIKEFSVLKGETIRVSYSKPESGTEEAPPSSSPTTLSPPDVRGIPIEESKGQLIPEQASPSPSLQMSLLTVPTPTLPPLSIDMAGLSWLKPHTPTFFAQGHPRPVTIQYNSVELPRHSKRREMWLSLAIAAAFYLLFSVVLVAVRYCRSRRNVPP